MRRIEHRFHLDHFFGIGVRFHHGRCGITADNDLLRQNLVGLAQKQIEAIDNFFLTSIMTNRFITYALRKHRHFRLQALLRHRGRIQLGLDAIEFCA